MYICYYGWKPICIINPYMIVVGFKHYYHYAGDCEWLVPGTWEE